MLPERINPRLMMVIGVLLMVTGIVLPALILIKILESTYFINFFSYFCQVLGLVLATLGLVTHVGIRRK
jgi:membrane protein implicated in regulation of membrane protease activity